MNQYEAAYKTKLDQLRDQKMTIFFPEHLIGQPGFKNTFLLHASVDPSRQPNYKKMNQVVSHLKARPVR